MVSNKSKSNPREQLLEKRIQNLQIRIRELERQSSSRYSYEIDENNIEEKNRSSYMVLPVTYVPIREDSPKLDIISHTPKDQSQISLTFVGQSKNQMYETIV